MRIGVVTASYPRVDGEHAGNFVAAHVAALRAAGHTVDVVGAHTIVSDLFYAAGAPDALERGGLRTYLAASRFSARLVVEVARRAHAWDLIIAHWLAPSALASVLGSLPRGRHVPILAIAHGGDVHTLRRLHLLAPTLHLLHTRNVRLAFVSHELRDLSRTAAPRLAHWLDDAVVQPMGIDVAHFAALGASRRRTDNVARDLAHATLPRVLVVARLVPVKGVDVAIRAMELARTSAQLVIAGDGPERAALESRVSSRVTFHGTVDAAMRDQLLREAACVVIPSRVLPNGRTEGTPMIALEALAAGIPVIASAVGGLRLLSGVTRVPPDDPHALAATIDRMLAVPVAESIEEAFAAIAPDDLGDLVSRERDDLDATAHRHRTDLADLDWTRVSDRLLRHAHGSSRANCETGESTRRRSV